MKVVFSFFLLTCSLLTYAQKESGMLLYEDHCAECHRDGGEGTYIMEQRLGEAQSILEERSNLSAVYIRKVVRAGLGSMAKLENEELSNSELERITDYLLESTKSN